MVLVLGLSRLPVMDVWAALRVSLVRGALDISMVEVEVVTAVNMLHID